MQALMSEIQTPTPSRVEISVIEARGGANSEVCGIVRCGIMKPGVTLCGGLTYCTVRQMYDEAGQVLTAAHPSTPVMLRGFKAHPKPGTVLMQVSSESHAEKYYNFMRDVFSVEGKRELYLQTLNQERVGNFYNRKPDHNNTMATDDVQVNIIVKAETFGSLQALLKQVYELPKLDGVRTIMKLTEVGSLSDMDMCLVGGGGGQKGCILVYGKAPDRCSFEPGIGTHVIRFDVLYHGIQAFKEALVGYLPKEKITRVMATAECLQVFKASQAGRNGNAGGMIVTTGQIVSDHLNFRVMRKMKKTDEVLTMVYEGQMKELRRFKELVPSVEQGLECGVIMFDEFSFKPGDILQQIETFDAPVDVDAKFATAVAKEEQARRRAMLEDEAASHSKQPLAEGQNVAGAA